jgi:CheY-like chemotaxis protein
VSTKKILVVDDDATHLLCAKEILEDAGYEVVIHAGGFGATEKVMVEQPDLVLIDVNMPALSGDGLVGVLRGREQTQRVPILLYSSNDEGALRRTVDRLGIEGYVSKGDVEELRRVVARVLQAA